MSAQTPSESDRELVPSPQIDPECNENMLDNEKELPLKVIKCEPEDEDNEFKKPKPSRKRKSKPNHISELPESSPAGAAHKRTKVAEKWATEAQYYVQFAKQNDKFLKGQTQIIVRPVLDLFRKELADQKVVKAYMLPLFYFVNEYSITIDGIYEFENVMVTTTDGIKKIEMIRKHANDVLADYLPLFETKDGKKYWKLTTKDFNRVKNILTKKKTCQ